MTIHRKTIQEFLPEAVLSAVPIADHIGLGVDGDEDFVKIEDDGTRTKLAYNTNLFWLADVDGILLVDPDGAPGTYPTLTAAIDDAVAGDIVYVLKSTNEQSFLDPIIIPDGVVVVCMPGAIVTSNGAAFAIIELGTTSAAFNHFGYWQGNLVYQNNAAVGLGCLLSSATSQGSGVGNGGTQKAADGLYAGVGDGGYNNRVSNSGHAGIGNGGANHEITDAQAAGIGNGGEGSRIEANYAGVAAGSRRAFISHVGAKLVTDSQNADFASVADDEFAVRAQGGVRFVLASGVTVYIHPDGAVQPATYTTAARPATGDGGRMIYDSTLGIPIWSDGAGNWRDAAGNIV